MAQEIADLRDQQLAGERPIVAPRAALGENILQGRVVLDLGDGRLGQRLLVGLRLREGGSEAVGIQDAPVEEMIPAQQAGKPARGFGKVESFPDTMTRPTRSLE